MTRVNKSRDGIIGPEPKPVASEPISESVPTTKTKPLKRMNKAELANVALSRQLNVEGMTKAKMLAVLE